MLRRSLFLFLVAVAVSIAVSPVAQASGGAPAVNVQQAAGTSAAAIQSAVDAYRADLGALNPNVAGSFGSGRREINWDGVPDAFAAPNLMPADFFNVNSPRGAVFATAGSGFQVSANAGVAPIEFDNINPTYSSLFTIFSPQRLFTALDSKRLTVQFFEPGSTTPATIERLRRCVHRRGSARNEDRLLRRHGPPAGEVRRSDQPGQRDPVVPRRPLPRGPSSDGEDHER